MSQPVVFTVGGLELLGSDLVRVRLDAPIPENAEGDDRRGAGLTLVVPLAEAQVFYTIGSRFDHTLVPHTEEVAFGDPDPATPRTHPVICGALHPGGRAACNLEPNHEGDHGVRDAHGKVPVTWVDEGAGA